MSSSTACTTICPGPPEDFGKKAYRVFFTFIVAAFSFVGGLVTNSMIRSIVDLTMYEIGIYYNADAELDKTEKTGQKLQKRAAADAVTFIIVIIIVVGLILLLEYINTLVNP